MTYSPIFGANSGALAVDADWPVDGLGGCQARSAAGAKCSITVKHTGTPHRFCLRHPHEGYCEAECFFVRRP